MLCKGPMSSAAYAKNMAGRTNYTVLVTVASPNGTPIKKWGTGSTQRTGHADKQHSNQRECEGANFAQMICKEVKKAFCKHSHKHKKCTTGHSRDSKRV